MEWKIENGKFVGIEGDAIHLVDPPGDVHLINIEARDIGGSAVYVGPPRRDGVDGLLDDIERYMFDIREENRLAVRAEIAAMRADQSTARVRAGLRAINAVVLNVAGNIVAARIAPFL
jgi:hypothetical protein